jgi:transposase-like protein
LIFRDICQEWAHRQQANGRLGGVDSVIEIDESKFFRAKYNRGRMLNRQYDWVFGLLERGTNKVRFFPVQDRTANTLLPIIADNVEPGSIIVSDGWAAYGGIANLQQQYDHRWVNHRNFFVDPTDRAVHTQGIEATWGALKRSLKHLAGTNHDLLPTYLYQYMFRRFHNNEKIFQKLLEEIRLQYPV